MEKLFIKRLGISITVLTFILFLINFMYGRLYFILIFVSFLFLISSFSVFGKYIQIGCLFISAGVTIVIPVDLFYALVQLFILVLLTRKYKLHLKKMKFKIIFSSLFYLSILFTSCYNEPQNIFYTISVILFSIIISTFIILINLDDFKVLYNSECELIKKIDELNKSILEKDKIINSTLKEYINPIEAGLTNAELLVLKNLCLYRESNIDLANRLNKSEYTIKNQLKNILLKIGVENRYQLTDVCKNYFLIFNH